MKNKTILLTGGAGYIGSHVLRQLAANGEDVIALDNLSIGFRPAVTSGEPVVGDTGNAARLETLFGDNEIDTTMRFAVLTSLAWERKIAARDPSAYWPA